MADEVLVRYGVAGRPHDALAALRMRRPQWADKHGYELVDASFDALIFERRATQKLVRLMGMGMSFGFDKTVWRVVVHAHADGALGTTITISGHADRKARQAIDAEIAALVQHDGPLI